MCVDQAEEPLDDEEKPFYPTSDIIEDLLSTLPSLPPDLYRRLNDAHCHPTDVPHSVSQIDPSRGGSLCAMSTRPNDQDLVSSFASDNPDTVVPFFGYHPWFAHLFSVDENHYRSILKPTPPDDFVSHLLKPTPWEEILIDLRKRLESNPYAQVGEIGMDKSFRLPTHTEGERDVSARKDLSPYRTTTEHQLRIFTDQLKLAGEFGRTVSMHSVQCHGLIFTALQSLWKGHEKSKKSREREEKSGEATDGVMTFPPRVCIHSASLPLDTLKQYLQPSVPSKVYFSFSTVINARYGQKLLDLISAVPDDRILIESDWHCEGDVRRDQVHDIARVVIHKKKWETEEGISILERNFRAFVFGK
jgi:Tat protein secretion system quality control protein TatD with DNase activity